MPIGKKLSEQRLFWVLSGILPLALFAAILLALFADQQEKSIRQRLERSADNAAHLIDRAIGEQIGVLNGLAASHTLDAGNLDDFRVEAQRLKNLHPEWRTVILTDQQQPIFNLRFSPDQPIPPTRDPESLARVWSTGQPLVGNLARDHVAVRVPVQREGRMRYTLVAPIASSFFFQALQTRYPRPWSFAVVGGDGKVIAASTAISGDAADPTAELSSQLKRIDVSGWQLRLAGPTSLLQAGRLKTRLLVVAGGVSAAALSVLLLLSLNAHWHVRRQTAALREEISQRRQTEKELHDSEERLQLALEGSQAGAWSWDFATGANIWSDTLWPLFGLEPHSRPACCETWKAAIHPDDVDAVERQLAAAVADKARLRLEWRVRGNGSGERWLMARGKPLRDNQGSAVGYLGIVMDVTERKQTEQRLRESEIALKEAQRLAAMGNWRWNAADNAFSGSDEAYRIAGLDPRTAPADIAAVQHLFAEHDWNRLVASGRNSLDSGQPFVCDAELIRADGARRWVAVRGQCAGAHAGAAVVLSGTIQDVTERKLTELALQQSMQRYRELVENANSAIIHWSRDGSIVFFNECAQQLFGWTAEEIKGRDVSVLLPQQPAAGATPATLIADIVARPQRFRNNINENIRRDGKRLRVNWTNRIIRDQYGQVEGVLSVGNDVTDYVRTEDELKRRNEELERFDRAAVGRELQMIELKRRINALSRQLGQDEPFDLSFAETV